MKGVFNLRPPLPRYKFTWDVSKVLNYLADLYPLQTLSLKELTIKLAALLSLSTAQRSQTLMTCVDNMSVCRDSVSFLTTSLMKTSKLGRTAQTIVLNKYEKEELCPVYTIKEYLERTKKK